jgi:hypothetical protein
MKQYPNKYKIRNLTVLIRYTKVLVIQWWRWAIIAANFNSSLPKIEPHTFTCGGRQSHKEIGKNIFLWIYSKLSKFRVRAGKEIQRRKWSNRTFGGQSKKKMKTVHLQPCRQAQVVGLTGFSHPVFVASLAWRFDFRAVAAKAAWSRNGVYLAESKQKNFATSQGLLVHGTLGSCK